MTSVETNDGSTHTCASWTGRFPHGVSLLCWAYNEEENIGAFLKKAHRLLSEHCADFEIVLVDDASTDATPAIAESFRAKHPELRIFRNEHNLNVGLSCRRAISCASKEFLFWQTVDWSYDISRLREWLELTSTYDVVQGVRLPAPPPRPLVPGFLAMIACMARGGHLQHRSDNWKKALVSIINYGLVRTLFRVPLSDYQNVTFYRTKWIQSMSLEAASSFVNPELLIRSYWNNKSFVEVPIPFIARTKGIAKGTKPSAILRSIRDIFHLWFRWIVLGRMPRSGRGRIAYSTTKP